MEPVRWGILSVSKHYTLRVHPQIKSSPLISLWGLASRSYEKAKATGAELGFQNVYGGYEELVQDPKIEAVYIPLPNHMHAEWIKKASNAGKHILCEKPLTLNSKEAEMAILHTRDKNVLLMEAFMHRFHPQWVHAREIVRCGELGDLRCIQVTFSYMNKDPQNIRNKIETGGGALMDIGCYAIQTCRFLSG
ncbi:MAG: Gfo/Idh/MocA family oxidoreductase, partial [Spirochaetales bacterium]